MIFSLVDLFRENRFGLLGLGCSVGLIHSTLGEPDAESRNKQGLLLKYGSIQLYAAEGRLYYVALYFHENSGRLPDAVIWEGWLPNAMTTPDEFLGFLAQYEIDCSFDTASRGQAREQIRIGSACTVHFASNDDGLRLYSIMLVNH